MNTKICYKPRRLELLSVTSRLFFVDVEAAGFSL